LHILNFVEVGVNPVFCDVRVRLCKPVPCPFVQGIGTISENLRIRTETKGKPTRAEELYCLTKIYWSVRKAP
jgi:hypothetical protein